MQRGAAQRAPLPRGLCTTKHILQFRFFLLLRGFVLQRSLCITTACTTKKTAKSTFAHHQVETVGDFGFQELNQFGITALVLIGDVERDDPAVGWALLELLPDVLAMVVFHDDDQIDAGNKLFGQRGRRVRIRASRHRLDARVVPEDIFGGRASQLVGGANEQDFHGGNYSAWRCAAESPFLVVVKVFNLHQLDFIVGIKIPLRELRAKGFRIAAVDRQKADKASRVRVGAFQLAKAAFIL